MVGVFGKTVPRQHGAWATLIACLLVGVLVAGRFDPKVLLLVLAVLGGFCAREAAAFWIRLPGGDGRRGEALGWLTLYGLIFAGAGLPLALLCGGPALPALGIAAGLLLVFSLVLGRTKRDERSLGSELLGIVGLGFVAPATEHVASGAMSQRTVGVWLLCLLFFVGSIFHVRYLVRHRRERAGDGWSRLRAGGGSLAYHLGALGLAWALVLETGLLPPLAPVALAPVAFKALWSVARRGNEPVAIKKVGQLEVVHTVVFVMLVALAYSAGAAGIR